MRGFLFEGTGKMTTKRTITIITATTGNPLLAECMRSVQALEIPPGVELEHLLVVDGPAFDGATTAIASQVKGAVPVRRHVLLENTGADGWLCHRIYGSMPMQLNCDLVAFLDEDNMLMPDHVRTLLEAMDAKGARWAHSLRTIVEPDGSVACVDLCESLGLIRASCLGDHHVDTSSYLMVRELAINLGPLWYKKLNADRQVAATLLVAEPNGACSRRPTLLYRCGTRGSGSVSSNFFKKRNPLVDFDPSKKDLYLWYKTDKDTSALLAEDATVLEKVKETYNVFDGFVNLKHLPDDARCVCVIDEPLQYLETLRLLKNTSHKNLHRTIVMLADLGELPENFVPEYADACTSTNDAAFLVRPFDAPSIVCFDPAVPDDLLKACTSDRRAAFKIVRLEKIEDTHAEGRIPLMWMPDDTNELLLSQELLDAEGSSWIDLRRAFVWAAANGLGDASRGEQVVAFLHHHQYTTAELMGLMRQRIIERASNEMAAFVSNI